MNYTVNCFDWEDDGRGLAIVRHEEFETFEQAKHFERENKGKYVATRTYIQYKDWTAPLFDN